MADYAAFQGQKVHVAEGATYMPYNPEPVRTSLTGPTIVHTVSHDGLDPDGDVRLRSPEGRNFWASPEFVTLAGSGYEPGQRLSISPNATDRTGGHLFGHERSEEYSYGFEYLPPFRYAGEAKDGDLVVADRGGEQYEVSPEFATPSTPILPESHDPVEHPAHYTRLGAEVIDISGYLNFPRGSAVKYLARAGHKEGADELEDLKKAQFFIDWEVERIERERKEGAW